MKKYKKKIKLEAKAFDKQVFQRKKFGLIPDLRKLKRNINFFNNPWREPEFFQIQWMNIINNIIYESSKSSKKNNILEIGCGTGFLSLELARRGHNVVGVDVSKKSIKEAENYKKKIKVSNKINLKYFVGDANFVNFKEKFDVLIFYRSLHHFSNLDKLFKNLRLYLNSNSKLIICEPMRKNFEKMNSIFSLILRTSLETWIKTPNKVPKKINQKFFENLQSSLLKEYTYKSKNNKKLQSPMDNSTDDPKKLIKKIKRYFKIKRVKYYDAFVDKIIGGLRGKNRFLIANLIKEFDNFLINKKILKGTTIYLIANKK